MPLGGVDSPVTAPVENSIGLAVWDIASADHDYGFRTWVNSALSPGGLQTLALTPTSEWDASLSTSGASAISTAGDTMRVDRAPAFDDDERGLIEYNASGLPEGATVRSATLTFDINQRSENGSVVPIVAAYGYHADGTPTDADARSLSQFLGQSAPIQNFDPVSIALDFQKLSSMLQTSPGIGVIAYEAVPYVGVSIVASQLANSSRRSIRLRPLPLATQSPPTRHRDTPLVTTIAMPTSMGPTIRSGAMRRERSGDSPADGDGDGDVDQDDYGVWRGGLRYATRRAGPQR